MKVKILVLVVCLLLGGCDGQSKKNIFQEYYLTLENDGSAIYTKEGKIFSIDKSTVPAKILFIGNGRIVGIFIRK